MPKEDAVALADGIDELLKLSVIRKTKLGQEARHRVCERYSLAKARESFEKIYSDLLMESKP